MWRLLSSRSRQDSVRDSQCQARDAGLDVAATICPGWIRAEKLVKANLPGAGQLRVEIEGQKQRSFPGLLVLAVRCSLLAVSDVLSRYYGQATKGVRWMPWR